MKKIRPRRSSLPFNIRSRMVFRKNLPSCRRPCFCHSHRHGNGTLCKREGSIPAGSGFCFKKNPAIRRDSPGFSMNLATVLQKGREALPIILATISTSLVIAYILSKTLRLPGKTAILIGVGSSICGGSAIAATAPVIDADDSEIAQSISVIFFFNIIAALLFPALGSALGLSNEGFGLFAGTAINDTSSVTAAASAWDGMHGSNTLEAATIVKLTRTLAIIPITLFLACYKTGKEKKNFGTLHLHWKSFSLLCTLFPAGLHNHYGISHTSRCYRFIKRLKQTFYRHGYGSHWNQYRFN